VLQIVNPDPAKPCGAGLPVHFSHLSAARALSLIPPCGGIRPIDRSWFAFPRHASRFRTSRLWHIYKHVLRMNTSLRIYHRLRDAIENDQAILRVLHLIPGMMNTEVSNSGTFTS
jgi:hypothetical protein